MKKLMVQRVDWTMKLQKRKELLASSGKVYNYLFSLKDS